MNAPHPTGALEAPGFVDRRLMGAARQADGRWLIFSTLSDPYGHWGMTRVAAMRAARECGVQIVDHGLDPKSKNVWLDASAGPADKIFPWSPKQGPTGFEEQGGLGLRECIAFIEAQSSAPIADLHALLRWVLVSCVLGHSEQHAGHIALHGSTGRLAPFDWMTVFPASVSAVKYPLAKGMKIGASWPDDFLMVHHWVQLSNWAGVKPKVVLSMAKDIADSIESILRKELLALYGRDVTMGAPSRALQGVAKRAQRLKEVHMAAPGQRIAGMRRAAAIDRSAENERSGADPEWE